MRTITPALALGSLLAAAACTTPADVSRPQTEAGNNAGASATTPAAPIAIGKTGHADGIDFTVTSAKATGQVGGTGGYRADAGETFVVVGYTIKNTSSKPLGLLDRPALSLVGPNGQSYDPDLAASGMASISQSMSNPDSLNLNPNVSSRTKAAWKVDKAAFAASTWRLSVASDPQLTFALK